MFRNVCGQFDAGLQSLLYLKNEWTDFLQAGANTGKVKVFQWLLGRRVEKWVLQVLWQNSKTDFIWRMNRWNKLFLHDDTYLQKLKIDQNFIGRT